MPCITATPATRTGIGALIGLGVAPGLKMPDRYGIVNRGLVNEKAPPGCPERRRLAVDQM